MASAQLTGTTSEATPDWLRPHAPDGRLGRTNRARDWAEIQERMLVPLYQAVYERLEVGPATSLLGIGCRSGLALLLAAERGAQVAGAEADPELRELATARGLTVHQEPATGTRPAARPDAHPGTHPGTRSGTGTHSGAHAGAHPGAHPGTSSGAHLSTRPGAHPDHRPGTRTAEPVARSAHSLVTVFEQLQTTRAPGLLVEAAARRVLTGGQLVLAAWGPAERCESASVLELGQRLAGSGPAVRAGLLPGPFALSTPGGLESLLFRAGLRPAGGGRVSCPFAYPDLESAVRGLLSTGLFDAALAESGGTLVAKELEEALHPFVLPDASVRMTNLFRYVVGERA
ncbi:SAM-dependent methyltransferase [Kitasatospora albolonga]|uniref:SAM-dependent methyltransferase n=1 Tax=Kitasatospora albolonga TaxID=68173 RepID=UPI0035F0DC6E